MRKIVYSKPAKNLIRFFCLNGIIVELLFILRLFLRTDLTLNVHEITNLKTFLEADLTIAIIDIVSLIAFIVLIFLPEQIVFFSMIAFLYSFKIIVVDTLAVNPIGQPLYLLGVSCLIYSGWYKRFRLAKILGSVIFNLILIGTSARYGALVCVNSYIASFGYSLILLVTLFFTTNFMRFVHIQKTARIWDLSQYPDLTQRDKEWLRDILDEKRYEEIANDSGITVGTLKNRMHQIFNIVGIDDRISLLATYGGYEVKF